jgi:L-lactate dehydrogenase complex protein LldG
MERRFVHQFHKNYLPFPQPGSVRGTTNSVGSQRPDMSTRATFADSLDALGVDLTRTTAEGFADALADAVDPPAVGTALPFDGASLADTAVDVDPTTAALEAATTGVTAAEFAIAAYGSVVIRPTAAGEGAVSLFVDHHVAVVAASDLVADMDAGVERLADVAAGGEAIVATGPSATADMGELVLGAHGPASVHVLLLEDR